MLEEIQCNVDLHIHSRFSAATSKNLTLKSISAGAKEKGVDIVGTGDCLHPAWFAEIKDLEEVEEGTFQYGGTRFVLTTEVEDMRRVHHLLLFPSPSSVEGFAEGIVGGTDLSKDGRPHLDMDGEAIAELAKDVEALIGPCHAFTPWTAMYAYHDSLRDCYGSLVSYVSFLELGLSADSNYADRISELHRLTFLTNSDAHSPAPLRLAREFNRLDVKDTTFQEVRRAIKREGGRSMALNVGLPPQEGKYNESACSRCYTHATLEEARQAHWRCPCGGSIKKGVKDRVEELADLEEPAHPYHRPPYLHIIPLGEILARALGVSSPSTKKVQEAWRRLVGGVGNEVTILVDAPMEDVEKHADPVVARAIRAFREGNVRIKPGGGGKYGEILLDAGWDEAGSSLGTMNGQSKLEKWF
ncbi:MAG: TIGR00375 family protein [Thermoplasmata archaeon]|nr:TIGR00375 family protein [Thermoplasmata archaeon]